MIYLNFTDLSEEAQNRLLETSKEDVKRKFGDSIRKYVKENYVFGKIEPSTSKILGVFFVCN